ncbi:hypothetical protein BOTBODRAFT_174683 [Botryobasidium botryosum FD-172 SS1]|uniref:SH3 domain-containing protein n=1 Tax=Botryobasidium botryosum (strain FD-172 SS1) TaxID=930990 RepID=A0A067MG49_BOTB1|nr:hypothetical protein BOTBODRAFT_174683 [Botryobasidium botryosum FD-172 SS1]
MPNFGSIYVANSAPAPALVSPAVAAPALALSALLPPASTDRIQVLWTYTPTLSDELSIQAGDLVKLIGEFDDGWALCEKGDGIKLSERKETEQFVCGTLKVRLGV